MVAVDTEPQTDDGVSGKPRHKSEYGYVVRINSKSQSLNESWTGLRLCDFEVWMWREEHGEF